ncbi:MAG: DNA-protecting protein DprA [Pyrinomonadaceae bacterium]|nr:DNA-protecting protein DprA [Phycisphaerales bacterium]
MPTISAQSFALLRLTLVYGLGPVLIGRAIKHFGSAQAVLEAPSLQLETVSRIGAETARKMRLGIVDSERLAIEELGLAQKLGVRIIGIDDAEYPPLLRQIPDPPPVLYVKGELRPAQEDRYGIAMVGSRSCSHYGTEQADRFAMHLAQAGLTIVSGGARGIDTAAHRAALRVKGRTLVVLGCGLSHVYPPENAALFDDVIGGPASPVPHSPESNSTADRVSSGAIISELPLRTLPTPNNFPARNRIISGISLGVIVIEAGRRSGALITARQAVEEHGREVFGVPGRVDSASSEGVLGLLKKGGAALVTHPKDVLDALESSARHHFMDTHHAMTSNPSVATEEMFDWTSLAPPAVTHTANKAGGDGSADSAADGSNDTTALNRLGFFEPKPLGGLNAMQQSILSALEEPRSIDELASKLSVEPGMLRAEVTMLEIRKKVTRAGSKLRRV